MVRRGEISIKNARIGFKNFSGNKGRFTEEGVRTFAVFFEDLEFAKKLRDDGWNIKWPVLKDENDTRLPFLNVEVKYKDYPPLILLINYKGKRELSEQTVEILDVADLSNVDLVISPYHWRVRDGSGIKAYLKQMFATLAESEFERQYRDLPDIGGELPGDDADL